APPLSIFFFQAEDGIRDFHVTGVQTCALPISTPSTTMLPCWCSSSRLMQRIIVDLPDPEGPQMTMRSLGATFRLMLRNTWNCPYHLLTSARRMMASDMSVLLCICPRCRGRRVDQR